MTKINDILDYLESLFPNAKCELEYSSDYSFLIAVMLSAQATDKAVNKVTKILFNKYKSLNDLANAPEKDVINIVSPLGLGNHKGKNVIAICNSLISNFGSKVPSDINDLISLPGVGIKTANVVRCELFNIPSVPVDTHVSRVSKRLNLVSKSDDVLTIEKKLETKIPKERQIKAHHLFIHFGRYFCKSQNPNCKNCKLIEICKEKHQK